MPSGSESTISVTTPACDNSWCTRSEASSFCACSNGRAILGELPSGSCPAGSSASQRRNAVVASSPRPMDPNA
jgi:hypothetical protein